MGGTESSEKPRRYEPPPIARPPPRVVYPSGAKAATPKYEPPPPTPRIISPSGAIAATPKYEPAPKPQPTPRVEYSSGAKAFPSCMLETPTTKEIKSAESPITSEDKNDEKESPITSEDKNEEKGSGTTSGNKNQEKDSCTGSEEKNQDEDELLKCLSTYKLMSARRVEMEGKKKVHTVWRSGTPAALRLTRPGDPRGLATPAARGPARPVDDPLIRYPYLRRRSLAPEMGDAPEAEELSKARGILNDLRSFLVRFAFLSEKSPNKLSVKTMESELEGFVSGLRALKISTLPALDGLVELILDDVWKVEEIQKEWKVQWIRKAFEISEAVGNSETSEGGGNSESEEASKREIRRFLWEAYPRLCSRLVDLEVITSCGTTNFKRLLITRIDLIMKSNRMPREHYVVFFIPFISGLIERGLLDDRTKLLIEREEEKYSVFKQPEFLDSFYSTCGSGACRLQ